MRHPAHRSPAAPPPGAWAMLLVLSLTAAGVLADLALMRLMGVDL